MTDQYDVVVIGAGAAGLLAATRAAELGRRVLLLEKNRKPGVKILMSGGTRCNLTHAVDRRGIIDAFADQGPFLHSPLAALSPDDVVQLFEAEGVKTKIESTGKIFPASDRALDVLNALLRRLNRSGATLALEEPVTDIQLVAGVFHIVTPRREIVVTKLVVTTGGKSFPGCGTTGDGYAWLERLGHTIVRPRPALTPVTTLVEWTKSLRGVTIEDVVLRVRDNSVEPASTVEKTGKRGRLPHGILAERRGSLLFTHWGLSGPVVLDVSRHITQHPRPRSLDLVCDFLPDTSAASLADQLQQLSASQGKKQMAVLLADWLPRRLVDALLAEAGLPLDRRAAELTRAERTVLLDAIKATSIPVSGTLGFEKAEVTAGGVRLDEVNSSTMQSKLVAGLYLAGEVLDLDGPIGGYNFQAAFSTGWLAGESCAEM